MPAPRSSVGLILVCLLLAAYPAAASSPPAWMLAQQNAAVPQQPGDANAVLLYYDTVLSVQPNGRTLRHVRKVYRILRPGGTPRDVLFVAVTPSTHVKSMQAWSIPPQGKPLSVGNGDAVEAGLSGVANSELMISDVRARLLRAPAVVPGTLVGFESEVEEQPDVLADEWTFQDTVPVSQARYELQLPAGWEPGSAWLNHAPQAPLTTQAGHWLWELKDIPAVPSEPAMPPWQGIAGRLVIAMNAPGHPAALQSWHDIGSWYLQLTQGRRDATPEIRQKVSELTAAAPTPLAKMQALAQFVQQDIRYVAIELGIGGYQPHAARDVLAHHYGDCKDKATLLASMLKEIGVDSHYLLVNTQRGAITSSTPPNRQFNHVILAIQLPENLQDPSLLALASWPQVGRVLLFDPTDSLTHFGILSGPLQAGHGLLVSPSGGDLVQLPQLPAEANALHRTGQLTLDADGNLSGDMTESWSGDRGAAERARLENAPADSDRIRAVETRMGQSLASFQIEKASVGNLHDISRPLQWRYTIQVSRYAKPSAGLLLVRPRVLGGEVGIAAPTPGTVQRHYPIELRVPLIDTDDFQIALPAGYKVDDLPAPVDVDLGFATYHSKSEASNGTLRYTRSLEIKELSIPPERAGELRQLYNTIERDERAAAVLKAVPPG